MIISCRICNKEFKAKPSKKAKYCSRYCYYKGSTGVEKHSEETKKRMSELYKRTGGPFFGKTHTKEAKQMISLTHMGSNHFRWKGDSVGYIALHSWIRRHKLRPELCEECKKVPPYDLANISQKYKRAVSDFEWLCRNCHMEKDGRKSKLSAFNKWRYSDVV